MLYGLYSDIVEDTLTPLHTIGGGVLISVVNRAVVAQVVGNWPGDREIPGPKFNSQAGIYYYYYCCFLEQELCPHCSSHPAVKPGTYCIMYNSGHS